MDASKELYTLIFHTFQGKRKREWTKEEILLKLQATYIYYLRARMEENKTNGTNTPSSA